MADEFTPINTQEEFDAAVRARYGDVAGLQNQVNTLTGERDAHAVTITELQNKIKGHEMSALRQKIAREKGLPFEMADRLSGETEKDIRADADVIAGVLKQVKGPAPLANHDAGDADAKTVNMTNMLHELRGE